MLQSNLAPFHTVSCILSRISLYKKLYLLERSETTFEEEIAGYFISIFMKMKPLGFREAGLHIYTEWANR